MRKQLLKLILVMAMLCGSIGGHAFSLSLDSIAEWGKFPRFCVNTYHWGDRFFNGYDTTYVKGTGYKFNVKAKIDSWADYYSFQLPNNMRMRMISDPSTSAGFWLTYLAVSVGYDRNISKFFGSSATAREQYSFGFNCSLFTFNMYFISNDVGTKIKSFGERGQTFNPNLEFNGMHSNSFGFDLYYFFNHKKYSQAAAFNFSRVQTVSHGSWFAGFSFRNQDFNFDFKDLPAYIVNALPSTWENATYHAKCKNFAVKVGYGYNWVFAKNWVLGISESPTLGIKRGIINDPNEQRTTLALSNQLRLSAVWNHKQWFAGVIGDVNVDIFYERDNSFENAFLSGSVSFGYRFNIW